MGDDALSGAEPAGRAEKALPPSPLLADAASGPGEADDLRMRQPDRDVMAGKIIKIERQTQQCIASRLGLTLYIAPRGLTFQGMFGRWGAAGRYLPAPARPRP